METGERSGDGMAHGIPPWRRPRRRKWVDGLQGRSPDSRAAEDSARCTAFPRAIDLAVALLCTLSPTVAGAVQALRRPRGRAHLFPVSSPRERTSRGDTVQ